MLNKFLFYILGFSSLLSGAFSKEVCRNGYNFIQKNTFKNLNIIEKIDYSYSIDLVPNKNIKLAWTKFEEQIDFSLKAETDGWISLGFTREDDQMIGSDAIIAYMNNNVPEYKEYFIKSYSSSDISPENEITLGNNVVLIYTNHTLELQFMYPTKLQNINIIWAVNKYPPENGIWEHELYGSLTIDTTKGAYVKPIKKDNYWISITYIIVYMLSMVLFPMLGWFCKSSKFLNSKMCRPNKLLVLKWSEFIILSIIATFTLLYILISYFNLLCYDFNFIQSSGYLTLLFLILITIPITKTNILVKLFESSFERTLKFHRMLGYMTVIFMILHFIISVKNYGWSILFSVEKTNDNGAVPIYGTIAFLCSLVMTITSLDTFRRKFFEIFYNFHMLFIVVFLFVILHYPNNAYFLILPFLFYGASIYIRISSYFDKYKLISATVSNNVACLSIKYPYDNIHGGQYFFLCIPIVSMNQWHPFSISSINYNTKIFTVHIKVNGDWTKKLYDSIESGKLHIHKPLLYVDGPYGSFEIQSGNYEKCIFIAGGIGITPMISAMVDCIKECSYQRRELQKMCLIWITKSGKDIEDFTEQLVILYNLSNYITVKIYVTDGKDCDDFVYAYEYTKGRPNIGQVILSLTNTSQIKNVGLFCCGPQKLVEEVDRYAYEHKYDIHKEIFSF